MISQDHNLPEREENEEVIGSEREFPLPNAGFRRFYLRDETDRIKKKKEQRKESGRERERERKVERKKERKKVRVRDCLLG